MNNPQQKEVDIVVVPNNAFAYASCDSTSSDIKPYRIWGRFLDLVNDRDNRMALEILKEAKAELSLDDAIAVNRLMDDVLIKTRRDELGDGLDDFLYTEPEKRNASDTKNRAIAILISIHVYEDDQSNLDSKLHQGIYTSLKHYKHQLNHISESVNTLLAVLSTELTLKPIYDFMNKLSLILFPNQNSRIDYLDRKLSSYFCYIDCTNREFPITISNLINRGREIKIGEVLHYLFLNPHHTERFEDMRTRYITVSFTMRFATENGIKILPLDKNQSGACDIKVEVENESIHLPILDLQDYNRKVNFLSLALEHTKFQNCAPIQTLLTIYDDLIETGEDVALLRMAGVLIHDFPSDKDCSDFINSVARNFKHQVPQHIFEDFGKLIEKTKDSGYKSRRYFMKLWGLNRFTAVGFLILAIGWICGIIQTVYTVMTYHK